VSGGKIGGCLSYIYIGSAVDGVFIKELRFIASYL
jgi:hypothetical protein